MPERVIPFRPWVTQDMMRRLLPAQERLCTAASLWEIIAKEALEQPLGRPLHPEIRDALKALSSQLITSLQLYDESEKYIAGNMLRCSERVQQQGKLFPVRISSTGQWWIHNRHDPSASYPLPPDMVCTMKDWNSFKWKWVSASSRTVFGLDQLFVVGKAATDIWGTYAEPIVGNSYQVRELDDLRIYPEQIPVNGSVLSRFAVRFPLVLVDTKYIATISFGTLDSSVQVAL